LNAGFAEFSFARPGFDAVFVHFGRASRRAIALSAGPVDFV
jgi:hypothetical protein